MAKRIKHSGKTSEINPHVIADGLGADSIIPKNHRGLKIVFTECLHQTLRGIGLRGAGFVFPFECLDGYDLERGIIFLAEDYEVWLKLSSRVFFFRSPAPNRPLIFVNSNRIISIKDLSRNKVLYRQR